MTIRLEEIGKFVLLEQGSHIVLPGERRKVRLEVNCQDPTQIMFDYGDEEYRFLANVEGRETVEFIAEGSVRLFPSSDGQVWWWTSELETSAVESNAASFTKIEERRSTLDPNLRRILEQQRYNELARERALRAERNAQDAQMRALRTELDALKKGGGDAGSDPVRPAADGAGGKPQRKGKADPAPVKGGTGDTDGAGGNSDADPE